MCYSLAEVRSNTVQDNIDEIPVGHLGITIESIDVILVCMHNTRSLDIANLLKSPLGFIVVSIKLCDGI